MPDDAMPDHAEDKHDDLEAGRERERELEETERFVDAQDAGDTASGGDTASEGDAASGREAADALPSLEDEVARLTDKLRRVEAEFVNETKRIRRQAEGDRKYAIEAVVVDLLPVIDALHGARDGLPDDDGSKPMREGLALVEQQLQTVFQRYGVSAIEALGKPFDPARHQAMLMVERADVEPQTVCEVMRVGYELHGRVVRPAEVLVAKAPTDGEDGDA